MLTVGRWWTTSKRYQSRVNVMTSTATQREGRARPGCRRSARSRRSRGARSGSRGGSPARRKPSKSSNAADADDRRVTSTAATARPSTNAASATTAMIAPVMTRGVRSRGRVVAGVDGLVASRRRPPRLPPAPGRRVRVRRAGRDAPRPAAADPTPRRIRRGRRARRSSCCRRARARRRSKSPGFQSLLSVRKRVPGPGERGPALVVVVGALAAEAGHLAGGRVGPVLAARRAALRVAGGGGGARGRLGGRGRRWRPRGAGSGRGRPGPRHAAAAARERRSGPTTRTPSPGGASGSAPSRPRRDRRPASRARHSSHTRHTAACVVASPG